MLNSYSSSDSRSSSVLNSSIKINATSAKITKSCLESWFETFTLDSERAKELFDPSREYDKFKKVDEYYEAYDSMWREKRTQIRSKLVPDETSGRSIILQMVLVGDNKVIAELVRKEVLDKQKENEKVEEEVI